MLSTGTSSSDIDEAFCPMDKNSYTKLGPDQDKILHCTKLQLLQETDYPDSYYQVVRFIDNIEDNSEKVPDLIYHD
jgi:hypothetical protein